MAQMSSLDYLESQEKWCWFQCQFSLEPILCSLASNWTSFLNWEHLIEILQCPMWSFAPQVCFQRKLSLQLNITVCLSRNESTVQFSLCYNCQKPNPSVSPAYHKLFGLAAQKEKKKWNILLLKHDLGFVAGILSPYISHHMIH